DLLAVRRGLRAWRQYRGVRLEPLAKHLGIPTVQLLAIEEGRAVLPSRLLGQLASMQRTVTTLRLTQDVAQQLAGTFGQLGQTLSQNGQQATAAGAGYARMAQNV